MLLAQSFPSLSVDCLSPLLSEREGMGFFAAFWIGSERPSIHHRLPAGDLCNMRQSTCVRTASQGALGNTF